MRIDLSGHNLILEAKDSWEVAPGWDDPSVHEHLGIYLKHSSTGVQVHVRSQGRCECELTAAGVVELLREQGWESAAFDVVEASIGRLVWAAGTFNATKAVPGGAVREWFVTDGERLANLCAVGNLHDLRLVTPDCDEIARSIRFNRSKG